MGGKGYLVPKHLAPALIESAKAKRHIKGMTLRFTHVRGVFGVWTVKVEKVKNGR